MRVLGRAGGYILQSMAMCSLSCFIFLSASFAGSISVKLQNEDRSIIFVTTEEYPHLREIGSGSYGTVC